MKTKNVILVLILLASIQVCKAQIRTTSIKKHKQTNTNAAKAEEKKQIKDQFEMKTYYLVLLKKGPKRDQDSVTAAKIQDGHMAHLTKMYEEGKMDLAGPMMDDWDVRGICVYNASSKEEVLKLVNQDPAIVSGRLVAEIHPWYAGKGSVLR